jgi:hypothetical protein
MQTVVVVGKVAASTAHLPYLSSPSGFDLDTGADRMAIAGGSGQAKADPRFAIAAVVPVKAGRELISMTRTSMSPSLS